MNVGLSSLRWKSLSPGESLHRVWAVSTARHSFLNSSQQLPGCSIIPASPFTQVDQILPSLKDASTSIRLLRLDTFDQSANVSLSCALCSFELTKAPEYSALSYTWGDPISDDSKRPVFHEIPSALGSTLSPFEINWKDRLWPVVVNGQITRVTRNLYDALGRLAPTIKGEWLWVDAICIDQGNLIERAAQVAIMAKIYMKAKMVKVWLGEEDETTEQVHGLQIAFCKAAAEGKFAVIIRDAIDPRDPRFWQILGIEPISARFWRSWFTFYRRNWFHRVWTMQEFALAQNTQLFCGSYVFDFDDGLQVERFVRFSGLFTILATQSEVYPPSFAADPAPLASLQDLSSLCNSADYHQHSMTMSWWVVCGGDGDAPWLLRLLLSSQMRQTTDFRDRVFGSLGMLRETLVLRKRVNVDLAKPRRTQVREKQETSIDEPVDESQWPKIDYAAHENTVAVATAKFLITGMTYLAYLSLITHRQLSEILSPGGLPSWVATLEPAKIRAKPFAHGTYNSLPNYDATRRYEFLYGRPKIRGSLSFDRGNLVASVLSSIGTDDQCSDNPCLRAAKSPVDLSIGVRSFEADSRILCLKGLCVDHVKKIIIGMSDSWQTDDTISVLNYLAETDPERKNYVHWRPEELWRTLTANQGTQDEYPAGDDTGYEFSRFLLSSIIGNCVAGELKKEEKLLPVLLLTIIHDRYPSEALKHIPSMEDVKRVIAQYVKDSSLSPSSELTALVKSSFKFAQKVQLKNRQLVELSSGDLALVPAEAEKGDQVVLLAGARVPFVARMHNELPDHSKQFEGCFQLIGESYVHGMMNGEVIDKLLLMYESVPWQDLKFL